MERYWQIEKMHLKHNIILHLLVCAILLGLSPLLMGVSNLNAQDTAKVLEMYTALTGIVMLTPIFLPEQSKDIRDLVNSKYVKSAWVYLLRLLGNSILLALILGMYIALLRHGHCQFPVIRYFLGAYAEILFLGALGIFFYGLCDNLIIGYMVPMMYYITAIGSGKKYLKLLYPFSMTIGSYKEKYVLAIAALLLIAGGIALRSRRH